MGPTWALARLRIAKKISILILPFASSPPVHTLICQARTTQLSWSAQKLNFELATMSGWRWAYQEKYPQTFSSHEEIDLSSLFSGLHGWARFRCWSGTRRVSIRSQISEPSNFYKLEALKATDKANFSPWTGMTATRFISSWPYPQTHRM